MPFLCLLSDYLRHVLPEDISIFGWEARLSHRTAGPLRLPNTAFEEGARVHGELAVWSSVGSLLEPY